MSAPLSNTHSITCPICHHTDTIRAGKLLNGLYTCPSCQTRLVVCWSGHYVRDPLSLQNLNVGQVLRRKSRPLSRLLRDVGALPWVATVGAIAIGITLLALPVQQENRDRVEPQIIQENPPVEEIEPSE